MAFPDFLPMSVANLTEATSINLAHQIQQCSIPTPLNPRPILTTYLRGGVEGSTPILLLHGFDSSVFEFRRLWPLLTPHHLTWAVDLLGFGFTERSPSIEINPANIKSHLYHFWATMIHRPIILVGASMGGAAAIDFALSYPQVVERLVLIDSAGFTKGGKAMPLWLAPLTYLAAEFLRNPWVRDRISRTAYHHPQFASADAATCAALHLACPRWRQAMASFTLSGGYPFLGDLVGQLVPPTLVLWGRSDRILDIQDAFQFERVLTDPKRATASQSALMWVDQCGHVPHLEQPDFTARAIQQFIS
jgi:pimeloyl-ACP methyl ester carboxylesterase